MSRIIRAALAALALVSWATVPPASAGTLDATPRVAVLSAFAPELARLQAAVEAPVTREVHGVAVTAGRLAGRDVVLALSGISMVNAAMTTQMLLDGFDVRAIVFGGIAGGVNPALAIGDVVVPARWAQYLEAVFARETADGFAPPAWAPRPFPAYGMIYPQAVTVRRAGDPNGSELFWFAADPALLEVAGRLAGQVRLERCTPEGRCLGHAPRLVVGGNGVSGQVFVDNATFRRYAFDTFKADVLDMESAAVAQVAYANGVPLIVFRSLSDLAGGGPGENEMTTFLSLAADNAAHVVETFLEVMPPAR